MLAETSLGKNVIEFLHPDTPSPCSSIPVTTKVFSPSTGIFTSLENPSDSIEQLFITTTPPVTSLRVATTHPDTYPGSPELPPHRIITDILLAFSKVQSILSSQITAATSTSDTSTKYVIAVIVSDSI